MSIIEDGTGSRTQAKVDSTNRLTVRSVTETGELLASQDGDNYMTTTGEITLTSASESGIFFLQNDEEFDLIIPTLIFNSRASTAGVGDVFTASIFKNPTSLSSPTAITPFNTNFGSSQTLSGTFQKGAEASAFTGGSNVFSLLIRLETPSVFSTVLILEKGSTIGISITPPPSNTSLVVDFSVSSHLIKII